MLSATWRLKFNTTLLHVPLLTFAIPFAFINYPPNDFWAGQEEGQRNLFNLALAAQVSLADDDTSTITVNRKQHRSRAHACADAVAVASSINVCVGPLSDGVDVQSHDTHSSRLCRRSLVA